MTVFLNGQFVPEDQAVISVFDRGFLYGDGLFEAVRVCNGKTFRWNQHLERLERGAGFLNLKVPFSRVQLGDFAEQLIARNQMSEALLRLTLSRGVGFRGYSPKGAEHPTLVMSLHPTPAMDPKQPPSWSLITSSFRVAAKETLTQFKTCNKLPQVLARAEADAAEAQEALLLNTDGYVVEASSSNLFWCANGGICTPPLLSGILAGVTRAVIMEVCEKRGLELRETSIVPEHLRRMDGVFLSLSTVGIARCVALDGQRLEQSPTIDQLYAAYWELVRQETGTPLRL